MFKTKQRQQHLTENLKYIYKNYLNESIENFDYIIEENKYHELNNFKKKKIFPRIQLIKIDINYVLLKINENVCQNADLYVEEVKYILKTIILKPKISLKNNFKNLKELEENKIAILNSHSNEILLFSPFIGIKINHLEYYFYTEELESLINNLNIFKLNSLNIILIGLNQNYVNTFFLNFSYFLPKNINKKD